MCLSQSLYAFADFGGGITRRNRISLLAKGILSQGSSTPGWIAGVQSVAYLAGGPMYWGLEVDYGNPAGPGSDLLVVGANLGMESVRGAFLIGGNLGLDAIQSSQQADTLANNPGFAVEPQAYFGFVIGGGWRLAFTGSYFVIPTISAYSGPTLGIRLDYKTETTIRPVDD